MDSLILNLDGRLRCQHTAKSVNHVAIVAVDYVAIGGLHFQTIARRPGAAAQHTPVATGCARAAFVSVEAPFPHVSAEIVQAYRVRLENFHAAIGNTKCATFSRCASTSIAINYLTSDRRAFAGLLPPYRKRLQLPEHNIW
jgi:hypothetical protein